MDLHSLSTSITNGYRSDRWLAEKAFTDYSSCRISALEDTTSDLYRAGLYENPWMTGLKNIESGAAAATQLMGTIASLSDGIKASTNWASGAGDTIAKLMEQTGRFASEVSQQVDSFSSLCKSLNIQHQLPTWYASPASEAIQRMVDQNSTLENLVRQSTSFAEAVQNVYGHHGFYEGDESNGEDTDSAPDELSPDLDADAVRASIEELVENAQSIPAASTPASDLEQRGDSFDCLIFGFLCGLVPAKFMEDIFEPSFCDRLAEKVDECQARGKSIADAAVTPREKNLLMLCTLLQSLWQQLQELLSTLTRRTSKP